MTKSFKATWLGDEDANAQIIRMGDLRFVKGEAETVPGDHEFAHMILGNPTFSTEGKAEPVEAAEPDDETLAEAAEQGTVKAALKQQIRLAGGEVPKGNPSEETLRTKLHDLTKA